MEDKFSSKLLKMKYKLNILFLLTIFIGLFYSCSKDEDTIVKEPNDLSQSKADVIETYTKKLPENVVKIETVTSSHPMLQKSELISKNVSSKNFKNSDNENAIYYFTNKSIATLSYNSSKVYATVTNEKGIEIENLIADFSQAESKNIVTLKYLNDGITKVVHIDDSNNKSWGSCMDGAIDELYDDWEDSPAGTFSCWVTGPLCAIGGGIACGIKQI
jgi:hypothetical protein